MTNEKYRIAKGTSLNPKLSLLDEFDEYDCSLKPTSLDSSSIDFFKLKMKMEEANPSSSQPSRHKKINQSISW